MKRLLWGTILLSLAMAPSAPAALGAGRGGGVPIRVSPGQGGIHTDFALRFSIPDATGLTAGADVADSVSVSGPGDKGCIGEADLPLRSAPAGTAFKLMLDPSRMSRHWCTGRFSGALVERRTTICAPGPAQIVCPLYVVAPRVLGRFGFTVTQPKKTHKAR
jgi:hypothetical protein